MDDIAFVTKLAGFEYTNFIADNLSKLNGVPLFKGKNVQDGEIIYEFESFIPQNVSDSLPRSQVRRKCLLTPYVGTIGNIGIHDRNGYYHLGSNVGKIELFNEVTQNIYEEYIRYYLMSSIGFKELTKHKKATAQDSISIDAIRDVCIALPPVAEQKRIISQIDNWLSLVFSIEHDFDDIQNLLEEAKIHILDLAIHGKLVPQDPNDEPAIELLRRINPKFTPCDNAHYGNIPNSWCMVRGKDMFKRMKSTKPTGEEFMYIDVESIDNKLNIISNPKTISVSNAPSRATRKLHEGDVLFSMVRPYLKNIALITNEYAHAIGSTGFYVISPIEKIESEYVYYLMLSPYVVDGLNQYMKGDNSPSINNKNVEDFAFPLPPLKEQRKIIEAIKQYYKILDDISLNL